MKSAYVVFHCVFGVLLGLLFSNLAGIHSLRG